VGNARTGRREGAAQGATEVLRQGQGRDLAAPAIPTASRPTAAMKCRMVIHPRAIKSTQPCFSPCSFYRIAFTR